MTEKKSQQIQKPTMSNTKKEMLDAYNVLLKQLQEKREVELKPEQKIEEKRAKEVIEVASSLSSEGVVKGISSLKLDMSKMLTQISDKLEDEVNRLNGIQKAIAIKEDELKELYEIEKSAATLAALIEAQNQKRQEYESEMAVMKEELMQEIENTRAEWEKEEEKYEMEIKEQNAAEKKKREWEKEEFQYTFKREQQLLKDEFEDEKEKLEREIQLKREQMEKELAEREKAISEEEGELNELRKNVSAFPKELETAVTRAVKETTERITAEAKNKEQLLSKEFEGERGVFTTRIESLEKTVKEQSEQIAKLSGQLEKSYQKVEDIAVKAIEGSSGLQPLANLQQMMADQVKGQSQEK
ncbi:MAG: hypothetical protein U9M96_05340 [Thermodesulfobacteriota bacterium]|nr:hypothetical protein [Thermodesulfobacteriota bacterium]